MKTSIVMPLIDENSTPAIERRVSFDAVEIREYNRILTDNPATSNGPPIGLGWVYFPEDTITLDLDTYESYQCDLRRSRRELTIPSVVREEILLSEGYTRSEIAKVVRETRKIRERRNISFHHQKYDKIDERVEELKRAIKSTPMICTKGGGTLARAHRDSISLYR